MKLQVAFDDVSGKRSIEILRSCHNDIDIIEAGTLLIIREGLAPLSEMRKEFPNATLLADPKILDAPEKIAKACFEAGADIVTVMSVSGTKVISKVIETAKTYGKKVFVDLLGCGDLIKAAKEADELGADFVCVHSSTEDDSTPNVLSKIKNILYHAELAAAGGINADNLQEYTAADILIAGSSVYASKDPVKAVRTFKEKINELSDPF